MITLAFANHKGGVGKTTSCHNIGAVLAGCERRVLMIDVDPQSSLTAAAGIRETNGRNMTGVMGTAEPGELGIANILQEVSSNLWLAPSDIGLAASEATMRAQFGAETVLKDALTDVTNRFDVVLIDCPPSLSIMTINALTAANAVLIPTQPSGQDLRGLMLFRDTLAKVKRRLNPSLIELGILVTFADERLVHHKNAIAAMEKAGLKVLPIRIGRSVRAQEAATQSQPIVHYDPENPVAVAYQKLGEGIDKWLSKDDSRN